MRIQGSIWRFIPAVILLLIAFALARLHREPVRVVVPPAMMRAGFAAHLVRRFSDDTGFPVTLERVPIDVLADRLDRGDTDIAFAHGTGSETVRGTAKRARVALTTTFVLVGPRNDPAGVRSSRSAVDAFRRVAVTGARYQPSPTFSAASSAATALWHAAEQPYPVAASQPSVREGLAVADREGAYMLIDRPTFHHWGRGTNLEILFEGDPMLTDVYTIAELPETMTHHPCGGEFWRWFHSPEGEAAVRTASIGGQPDFNVAH